MVGYGRTPFRITFLSNQEHEPVTDRDGRFRVKIAFTGPPGKPTDQFLFLRKKGFASMKSPNFSFRPEPGDPPHELEPIRMEPGVSLNGTVVDPRGMPVEGAWVRLLDAWSLGTLFTRTDADGRFVLDDLPGGSVKLQVDFGSLTAEVEAVATEGDEGLKIQLRPVLDSAQPFHLAPPTPGVSP